MRRSCLESDLRTLQLTRSALPLYDQDHAAWSDHGNALPSARGHRTLSSERRSARHARAVDDQPCPKTHATNADERRLICIVKSQVEFDVLDYRG
jgi:hypothetical protein